MDNLRRVAAAAAGSFGAGYGRTFNTLELHQADGFATVRVFAEAARGAVIIAEIPSGSTVKGFRTTESSHWAYIESGDVKGYVGIKNVKRTIGWHTAPYCTGQRGRRKISRIRRWSVLTVQRIKTPKLF